MNFERFKELFGYEGNEVRQIKVGNDTIIVDNKNFTYQNQTNLEREEARKRLLTNTQSAQNKSSLKK